MKRLFEVEVAATLYVLAENERDAEKIAESSVSEEEDNFEFFVNPVENLNVISPDWRSSLPYGSNPEQFTVAEAFAAYQEAMANDPTVVRERLEAAGQVPLLEVVTEA